MTLTRQHFQLIADVLKRAKFNTTELGHRTICEDFADELAKTNPNFNRRRFLTACGVET